MTTKQEQMTRFWSDRCRAHGSDPRANTNDIHLRTLEINYVAKWIAQHKPGIVLDFGCANGYTTLSLAKRFADTHFIGLDINTDMIAAARQATIDVAATNVAFVASDILKDPADRRFDFIFAVRAFQNLPSTEAQRRIADVLIESLRPSGVLLYLESYRDAYFDLNRDRRALDLDPLPIHDHLTLLTSEFDEYVRRRLELVVREAPTSSYYLITRLIYSAYATHHGEPIDYDHLLHRLAAQVPQIGEFGPQRACVFRRPVGESLRP